MSDDKTTRVFVSGDDAGGAVSFENPGEVLVRQGDSTGWLNHIIKADPVALFSSFVLESRLDDVFPCWPGEILRLTPGDHVCGETYCSHLASDRCFVGWKVECIGANASYTYIIKYYDWQRLSWIGAWPD